MGRAPAALQLDVRYIAVHRVRLDLRLEMDRRGTPADDAGGPTTTTPARVGKTTRSRLENPRQGNRGDNGAERAGSTKGRATAQDVPRSARCRPL